MQIEIIDSEYATFKGIKLPASLTPDDRIRINSLIEMAHMRFPGCKLFFLRLEPMIAVCAGGVETLFTECVEYLRRELER